MNGGLDRVPTSAATSEGEGLRGRLELSHMLRLRSDGLSGNKNKILWLTKTHRICFELEQVHIWKLW